MREDNDDDNETFLYRYNFRIKISKKNHVNLKQIQIKIFIIHHNCFSRTLPSHLSFLISQCGLCVQNKSRN